MLIIDINHGGLDLFKEYTKLGYSPKIWDIYGKLENKKIDKKIKENLFKFNELPNFDNYDLIVAPIHCPINLEKLKLENKYKSFHEGVSEIINKKYGNIYKKFIDITGVKGKTTTTELINHILKEDYSVFLNNSNYGSIAPTEVLNCINKLNNLNKLDNYDLFIFEISLGITKCNYGSLLNIIENYSIGNNKRTALYAKYNTLKLAKNKYINKSIIDNFKLNNTNNLKNINIVDINSVNIISNYPILFKYNNKTIKLNNNLFGKHFIENILFSFEICKNFLNEENIIDKLKTFKINNRMNIYKKNNYYIVKNINPGLNVKSINNTINDFINQFKTGIIIIGGDFGCTCEEIHINKLSSIIKKYIENKNIKIILCGNIGKELKKHLNLEYINKLENINNNINISNIKNNLLIIYRKKIV